MCVHMCIYTEDKFKGLNSIQSSFTLKNKTFNKSCHLNQHYYYYYLKCECMQLKSHHSPFSKHKPLLLVHIAPFHISSRIKYYSSQFLKTPRAAEKHRRFFHAHWPGPGSGAVPSAQHLKVMTETDCKQTCVQATRRTEQAAAFPGPVVW